VDTPPAPDLINWKNKGKRVVPRVVVSWLITLGVCFGSYLLFAYIQLEQDKMLSTYNFESNCGVLFQPAELSTFSLSLDASSSDYFSCFCQTNLFNFDSPDYDRCHNWRVQYATYLAIPVVISLLLVVYNVVVKYLFKLLTYLEAHRLITNELYSYTIKRAFLFIMNMGLIIILINTQYNTDPSFTVAFSFLVQGKYKDVTADWYINIGSIIILTMLFNVSFPLIELAFASIIKCLRRCWDRKVCCRATSCKTKEEYVGLFSNDVYPIEERYAFLIAIFMVTLIFACVIPILWVVCFLSVFLLYLADKLLIFKLYQTPINYNADLHQLLMKSLYFGIVAHMALSAFFLSEPMLLAQNSSISQTSQWDAGSPRLNAIIHTSYIIPYVVLFLLLAGWLVFDNTVISLFVKCALLCRKNLSTVTKYKLTQDYFESINRYQLAKLRRITESEINKVRVKGQSAVGLPAEYFAAFEDTMKSFSPSPVRQSNTKHEIVIKKVLEKIRTEETLRPRDESINDVYMIGMPGYEIMLNEQAFDQNKRNLLLTEGLHDCLKDVAKEIEND
jgi:hypothetical protein